jgi:antitoxin component YwqK of YwqJK toxin-antitoxin module
MAEAVLRVDAGELEWEDYVTYYQGKPFSGVAVELRPNGSVWSEETYLNGLLDGVSRDYHENGSLDSETVYKQGIANGPSRAFYASGQPKYERMIELGICVRSREYDEQGRLIKEEELQPQHPNYRLLQRARESEGKRVEQIQAKLGAK